MTSTPQSHDLDEGVMLLLSVLHPEHIVEEQRRGWQVSRRSARSERAP